MMELGQQGQGPVLKGLGLEIGHRTPFAQKKELVVGVFGFGLSLAFRQRFRGNGLSIAASRFRAADSEVIRFDQTSETGRWLRVYAAPFPAPCARTPQPLGG